MENKITNIPNETLNSMGIFLFNLLKAKLEKGEIKIEEGKIVKQ